MSDQLYILWSVNSSVVGAGLVIENKVAGSNPYSNGGKVSSARSPFCADSFLYLFTPVLPQ